MAVANLLHVLPNKYLIFYLTFSLNQ